MAERIKPELAMNYSRTEGGLAVRLTGAALVDAQLLTACIGPGFLAEMERRGYDLKTLRFSIRKRKGVPHE